LAKPEQQFGFFQKLAHSKVKREFAEQVELLFFQKFVALNPTHNPTDLRVEIIDNIG
jgi:hypothetical protein